MDRTKGAKTADETISRRERTMLTLAFPPAIRNFKEIPVDVHAAARADASPVDIIQTFLHLVIFAGVPHANHAIKRARKTLAKTG